MKTKQLNPGPGNCNLLENIKHGDIVRFKGDDASYIAQDRKAQRTDADHYWFRPQGSDKGFTIPRPLMGAMNIEEWLRPEPKHRFNVIRTITVRQAVTLDASDTEELCTILRSNPDVVSFEIGEDLGEVGEDGKLKRN
jgi:hypothetical protein